MSSLLTDVFLHVSPQKFYFASASQDDKRRVLIIDRVTFDISLEENAGQIPGDILSRHAIAGILGIVSLSSGPAVIVAKTKKKIGDITSHNYGIFELGETEIFSYAKSDHHLTRDQQEENNSFVSMLQQVLNTPGFYFSLTTDLTNTIQRKKFFYQGENGASFVAMFSKWDRRFVWNRHMLSSFIERGNEFLRYCIPLINGAVFIRRCSINGKLFRYTIISRRSVFKCGTRFFARGCDDYGNCANFIETEQIVETGNALASFVQTRGSIPLFWKQTPNVIEYKPDPVVETSKKHIEGYVKHFTEQIGLYGQQVIVNLIDQKRGEGLLESHFRAIHQAASIPGVDYIPYDFHKECSNLKWDRLSSLVLDLEPYLQKFGYYLSVDGIDRGKQSGVIRTNCMDCLDRTNVVQSMISSRFLQDVLISVGVLLEGQLLSSVDSFQLTFRNMWADHADILSVQYAGTGALKTDYTRTGKRTVKGMMKDLQNSLLRYYKNNFSDGFRQDAIDFFLGNFVVTRTTVGLSFYAKPPPTNWLSYLPPIFVINCSILFLIFLLISDYDLQTIIFIFILISINVAVGRVLYRNAKDLVDMPKLRTS